MSDLHLDRRIIARAESKHQSLYKDHLAEVDAEGKQVGRDLIPWNWSLDFLAVETLTRTTLDIREPYRFVTEEKEEGENDDTIRHDHDIVIKLIPSQHTDPHGRFPRYSMMGTERYFRNFKLYITSLGDEDAKEGCKAWGCPAWTTEVDFRDMTVDDEVMFMLGVKPSTFAQYTAQIHQGAITTAVFRVSGVDGFYSDWSPAISTDLIKVLTPEKNHVIELPDGMEDSFVRLGKLREASLTFLKVIDFPTPPEPPEPTYDEDEDDFVARPAPPTPDVVAAQAALRIEQRLATLRLALWIAVGLLALIAVRSLHIL